MKSHQLLFKHYPTKKTMRTFLNYYLRNHKVGRMSTYNKDHLFFYVKIKPGEFFSCPNHCRIQSIGRDEIWLTINCKVEMIHILNVINFFARDEKSRAKMNFPIIRAHYDAHKTI